MERPAGVVEFTPDPTLFPFESRWFDSSVGPVHYIETEGADTLLERLQDLEQRLGSRFKPAPGWDTVAGFADQGTING